MTDYRAQVCAATKAVRFRRSGGYFWCGVARRPVDEAHSRPWLLWSLRDDLYENFYCHGEPVPPRPVAEAKGRDPELEHALVAANLGQGYWQNGWRVNWHDENAAIVSRDGLSVMAPMEDVRPSPVDSMRAGVEVAVHRAKGSVALSPGAYVAAGDIDLPDANASQVVRLYWNLKPRGAVELMRIITSALNKQECPFRLKAANQPQIYERSDPVVLYVTRGDYDPILPLIESAHRQLSVFLRPGTPALTKRLAPGLALAEDPPAGESFGRHRCGIIAEALLDAVEQGITETSSRLETVERYFEEAGLSLTTPYLNPGSSDSYEAIQTS